MVGDRNQPGIMVRALNEIFQTIREKEDEYEVSWKSLADLNKFENLILMNIVNIWLYIVLIAQFW